jgi:uncharacterized membrane-anchored protein
MASTFLTRLRLGPVLVDAKGVNQLYEGRVRRLDLVLLIARPRSLAILVVADRVAPDPHDVRTRCGSPSRTSGTSITR